MKDKRLLVGATIIIMLLAWLPGCGGKKEAPFAPKVEQTAGESVETLFAKARGIKGMQYDMVMTVPGMPVHKAGMWFQDERMRMETSVEGRKTVMIYDKDVMYSYDVASNRAMMLRLDKNMADTSEKPEAPTKYTEKPKEDWKIIGTETVDGVKCKVIQGVDKEQGSKFKMWVREDYGLPMRMEIETKDGKQLVMEYKNMKIGPIADEIFKIPAGVQVMTINH